MGVGSLKGFQTGIMRRRGSDYLIYPNPMIVKAPDLLPSSYHIIYTGRFRVIIPNWTRFHILHRIHGEVFDLYTTESW